MKRNYANELDRLLFQAATVIYDAAKESGEVDIIPNSLKQEVGIAKMGFIKLLERYKFTTIAETQDVRQYSESILQIKNKVDQHGIYVLWYYRTSTWYWGKEHLSGELLSPEDRKIVERLFSEKEIRRIDASGKELWWSEKQSDYLRLVNSDMLEDDRGIVNYYTWKG